MSSDTVNQWTVLCLLATAAPCLAALKPGDAPPAARATNQDGKVVNLDEFYGHRPLVLFFYPKSFTPGCTIEVQAFRDNADAFEQYDAAVFGVSRDEQATQRKFCDAYKLAYDLLADVDGKLSDAFGIPSRGTMSARWTVVVGRSGKVILVDDNVNANIKGHPDKVLTALDKDWKAYLAGFKPLFNGKNLEGWTAVADAPGTWSVKDGILECSGKPTCYLRTEEPHKDYHLLVEFKYTDKLGNAGVLLHITGEDRVWPQSIEPNLDIDQMGRIYPIGGAKLEFAGENPLRKVAIEPGEWHRYEIICDGDAIRVLLDGQLVNEARKADPASGSIGIQSEGVPLHFRTIAIRSLTKKMPASRAAVD